MSVYAVAEAVKVYEDSNRDAELSLALFAIIVLAPSVVALQQAGITQINQDAQDFKTATQLSAIDPDDPHAPDPDQPDYPLNGNGPPMSAVAASLNEKKTIDQNQSNIDNKRLSNLVEETKSMASMLGNTLSKILEFAQNIKELLDQIKSLMAELK